MSISISKKQSQSSISLLRKNIELIRMFTVYIQNRQGGQFSIRLTNPDRTVADAIKFSIETFNRQYGLDLKDNIELYELYGAKKNGKMKTDLPSIQHGQSIIFTKLERFYLKPLYKATRLQSKKSSDMKSIKMEMQLSSTKSKMPEIREQKYGFCFCMKS